MNMTDEERHLMQCAERNIRSKAAENADLRAKVFRLSRVVRTQASTIETLRRATGISAKAKAEKVFNQ